MPQKSASVPSSGSPLRQKLITEIRVRHYSPRTEEAYVHAIYELAKYYHRSPDQLDYDAVVGFLEYCVRERKLSHSTVNVYFQACRFLYEKVLKRDVLAFKLPRRSRPRTRPQILSPEEVLQLINAPDNLKHKALLHMTYGSGLRVSEVVRLLPRHIEADRMMLFVKSGKGHKDRYTLLSQAALEITRTYWREFRPTQWLFPGRTDSRPMTEATAQQIYDQAVTKSGVRKIGGIHTLRHCFATHQMENGVDIYAIKRFLGHNSIVTTSRYMHVRQERLRKVVSPLDLL